jgi:hypothetical protein
MQSTEIEVEPLKFKAKIHKNKQNSYTLKGSRYFVLEFPKLLTDYMPSMTKGHSFSLSPLKETKIALKYVFAI